MWLIIDSPEFLNWVKKEKVDNETLCGLRDALFQFRREPTPRTKSLFISNGSFYEIWDIRVPDKNRNEGASSGFRVMFRLNNDSKIIKLEIIIRRKNLSFRGSQGKYQNSWDQSLKEFKKIQNYF